jgi:hypothetical protein
VTEYDNEPTPGLPGRLPPGERIVWQGSPDWRALARTAFHTRLVAGYFVVLAAIAAAVAPSAGGYSGVVLTAVLGIFGVALLHLLAWASARTTIYTLTNRRIVLRIGIAVPKCINLPLASIAAVDLATRADSTGDVPLTLIGAPKLGYLALWPHTRPWRVNRPHPMLRSVPDAVAVATTISRACLALSPDGLAAGSEAPTASTRLLAQAA